MITDDWKGRDLISGDLYAKQLADIILRRFQEFETDLDRENSEWKCMDLHRQLHADIHDLCHQYLDHMGDLVDGFRKLAADALTVSTNRTNRTFLVQTEFPPRPPKPFGG